MEIFESKTVRVLNDRLIGYKAWNAAMSRKKKKKRGQHFLGTTGKKIRA